VANGRALVANAQRNLGNTVLYAPVAGTISSITGAVGEYVGQGGPMLGPRLARGDSNSIHTNPRAL
jgi:multidrug resistance efflux pump